MDIFTIHENIIGQYRRYINSFIQIRDEHIERTVRKKMDAGALFPHPLIQFNPDFARDKSIDQLVEDGFFHPEMGRIFGGYQLYQHQVEALDQGRQGNDFIVTSGTGSGKSLTYIGTIFDRILRRPEENAGVKAIIVYPMNALINSQSEEFRKFHLHYLQSFLSDKHEPEGSTAESQIEELERLTGKKLPISYAQYTGQESQEQRNAIKEDPPHILMTNYMMLELIMTRVGESPLRESINAQLEFLVFDELHTYRGRQGADVAMLIRRIRAAARKPVQCIGTSATMASAEGGLARQKETVASVGKLIFGKKFEPYQIINESLRRLTNYTGEFPAREALRRAIHQIPVSEGTEEDLKSHPLAIWLENEIGLEESGDGLHRRNPQTFEDVVAALRRQTGCEREVCEDALKNLLAWATRINRQLRETGQRRAYFPFRLHQFISQTGSVYLTLDEADKRLIQLEAGHFVKFTSGEKRRIYQAVFSRITGHEFICVYKNSAEGLLEPRDFSDTFEEAEEEKKAGYLIPPLYDETGQDTIWSEELITELPDSWHKKYRDGRIRVVPKYRKRVPTEIYYTPDGQYWEEPPDREDAQKAWFMPTRLLFDPTSGIFFDPKSSEAAKLMRLGNEGRSTATTVLSNATIAALNQAHIPVGDQKLLSFTDNRQDASLQAGHFNDFISIARMRSAIYRALVVAPDQKLGIDQIAESVLRELDLDQSEYAERPAEFGGRVRENEQVLKEYLTIRILQDLKRGWRYTMPNLEQCGLLDIHYKYIKDEVEHDEVWRTLPLLSTMTPDERLKFLTQTLDYIRTSNAIKHRYFFEGRNSVEQRIKDFLKNEWTLGSEERLETPNHVRVESIGRIRNRDVHTASVGKQSNWGKYVTRQFQQHDLTPLRGDDFVEFAHSLFGLLERMGLLEPLELRGDKGSTQGYILPAEVISWQKGDGQTVRTDEVRTRSFRGGQRTAPNPYFQHLYREGFEVDKKLLGREHTGQINHEDRIDRETRFRSGEITTLFCSPTMELGIDISNLNVVHMRNVPPNPANYAQRSGRAGRSGQGALVITYCSQLSPHDQHYFHHATEMVAGKVVAPRINIDNEELVRSHIQAVYLQEAGLDLGKSLRELINFADPALPLRDEVRSRFTQGKAQRIERILTLFQKISHEATETASLLSPTRLRTLLEAVPQEFDAALERWRGIYRRAVEQRDAARRVIDNPTFTAKSEEKRQANRNVRFALNQIDELYNEGRSNSFSEFYPFRYLASEGFLPGYNFTRLPLRTSIDSYKSSNFISRPRLLALREFGPRNLIYHNGKSYLVDRINEVGIEENRVKAKVAKGSGYILLGDDEIKRETCPITNVSLENGSTSEKLHNLLEMAETSTREMQRISCEEEERRKTGYDIRTYFSLPGGVESCDKIYVRSGDENLLEILYMPSARIVQVNVKWRRSNLEYFIADKYYGFWKRASDRKDDDQERIVNVSLYTSINTNALYIQPTKSLGISEAAIVTLQYALKRAVQEMYQVEGSEIGAVCMGKGDSSNIMLFEASEGSLGVLNQLTDDHLALTRLLEKAYEICHFEAGQDIRPDLGPATYNDLLSYYNQPFHEILDRHLVKEPIERLLTCTPNPSSRHQVGDYDTQYRHLLATYDESSSTERLFLKFLFDRGLRLPDKAQPRLSDDFGLYVMPDFQYDNHVFVFCDGTPHDRPEVAKQDRAKRRAMRDRGLRPIIYHYRDDLDQLVEDNKDIFRPVMPR